MPDQDKDKELEAQWISLVHEGACCAQDDPQQGEKDSFCREVLNASSEKPENGKQT